ncbi:phospholipase A [Sulfurivirga sp.]|uniref:phospholipase A n=1 Tax=Sulfurivirga sp. TaxID=2614236 RepID=UPI0025CC08EC|nr:phospholipase A [Sulfurivirga sp.]
MLTRTLLTLILLITLLPALADDWVKRQQQQAQQGQVDAMLALAVAWQHGLHGLAINPAEARAWLEKARQAGSETANLLLSQLETSATPRQPAAPAETTTEDAGPTVVEPSLQLATTMTSLVDVSDDIDTRQNVRQLLGHEFGLYPYKANYFLPWTLDTRVRPGRSDKEAKFQISLMKPLLYNALGLKETWLVGYTQQSHWQIYSASAPFRETNYEPEAFVVMPFKWGDFPLRGIKLAINHQSNGRGGAFSRSWNRLYASGLFQWHDLLFTLRAWYRIPEPSRSDDNPDITHYLGYGDLHVAWPIGRHLLSATVRNNLDWNDNRGAVQLDWSFPIKAFHSTFGYVQLFSGYGESLIDYNREITKIGVGLMWSR